MTVTKIITYVGEIEDTDINLEIITTSESKLIYPDGHEKAGLAVDDDTDTHLFRSFSKREVVAKIKIGDETVEMREDWDGDVDGATARLTAALADKLGVSIKSKEVAPVKLGIKE